jgi:hypothetical protein
MLSSLKRFFGGKPAFEILQSSTGVAAGGKPAVLLSAALHSASGLDDMTAALLAQFKNQRMVSPAETDLLLITVVGPCDATRFVKRWRMLVAHDQIAAVFMQRMTKADVGCSDTGSFHSLIPEPQNA